MNFLQRLEFSTALAKKKLSYRELCNASPHPTISYTLLLSTCRILIENCSVPEKCCKVQEWNATIISRFAPASPPFNWKGSIKHLLRTIRRFIEKIIESIFLSSKIYQRHKASSWEFRLSLISLIVETRFCSCAAITSASGRSSIRVSWVEIAGVDSRSRCGPGSRRRTSTKSRERREWSDPS